MNDLQFIVAGTIAGAVFAEIVIRLGTSHRLSTLLNVTRKATSVIASKRVSDHWKEIAVPRYAMLILRTVAVATFQLVIAAAIYATVIVVVLTLWIDVEFSVATFLELMLNMGALAGGTLYAVARHRVVR
jgi:hypothetical protein